MPKFRSMLVGTPDVATHLLADPKAHLTPNGRDELPQLWSRALRCLINMNRA
jgi:O-antigen biosynthesis protein WbqP